jgi:hypothetical protein
MPLEPGTLVPVKGVERVCATEQVEVMIAHGHDVTSVQSCIRPAAADTGLDCGEPGTGQPGDLGIDVPAIVGELCRFGL